MLDLKDAFHSLRLSENSKKYCGILLYFDGTSYLYQRMPMGLHISPSIWQSYINAILHCLQSKKYCEAIMNDLLLFMPSKSAHRAELEDLLSKLIEIFAVSCSFTPVIFAKILLQDALLNLVIT